MSNSSLSNISSHSIPIVHLPSTTSNPITTTLKEFSNVKEVLEMIEITELLVVYFYAPWCGTCKKADPLYFHASQLWKDSNLNFTRFEVESEEAELECEEVFDLFFVPCWKIWKGGELIKTIEGDWTEFEPALHSIVGPPTNQVVLDQGTEKRMEFNRYSLVELSKSIKEKKKLEVEKEASLVTTR